MANEEPDRRCQAVYEYQAKDHSIQPYPVDASQGVLGEVGPDSQLVPERENQGQIGVEVDPGPGLVGDAGSDEPHRTYPDGEEQAEPREGCEHVRVGDDYRRELVQDPDPLGYGVARHAAQHMKCDEGDSGEADQAVVSRGSVAEQLFE